MIARAFRQDPNTDEDTAHRAPLPAWVPRPVKRMSGRTKTLRTPAHVRVIGVALDEHDRALIRRKLGMKLGKFVASIERVTVRVTDANGPRGGIDHACNVRWSSAGYQVSWWSVETSHRTRRSISRSARRSRPSGGG